MDFLVGKDVVVFDYLERCRFISNRTETLAREDGKIKVWSELQLFDNILTLETMQTHGLDSVSVVMYIYRDIPFDSKIIVNFNDDPKFDDINLYTRIKTPEDYIGDMVLTFAISDLKNETGDDGYKAIEANNNTLEKINIRFVDENPENGRVEFRLMTVFLH